MKAFHMDLAFPNNKGGEHPQKTLPISNNNQQCLKLGKTWPWSHGTSSPTPSLPGWRIFQDSLTWWLFEFEFVTQGGLPVTGGFTAACGLFPGLSRPAPQGSSACQCQVPKQIATILFSGPRHKSARPHSPACGPVWFIQFTRFMVSSFSTKNKASQTWVLTRKFQG